MIRLIVNWTRKKTKYGSKRLRNFSDLHGVDSEHNRFLILQEVEQTATTKPNDISG